MLIYNPRNLDLTKSVLKKLKYTLLLAIPYWIYASDDINVVV